MSDTRFVEREHISSGEFRAFRSVYRIDVESKIKQWTIGVLLTLFLFLFLPWTQNIRAKGDVTTLRQEQRPQKLNSIIAGRIVKWHVKEGDFVRTGDTIAQLAEVKDSYLDPELLSRTEQQIDAKEASVKFYGDKAAAAGMQLDATKQTLQLKLLQLQNKIRQIHLKIVADSMDVLAATNDYKIAVEQFRRQQIMRDSGLASLVQLEQRNQSMQSALAKRTSAEIKFTNTKTDLVNANIELSSAQQEYAEKLFKIQGDRAAAQSEIASGQGEVAKLKNQYANYRVRSGMYYLLAPQDGQVVQAARAGINEVIKEGEILATIIPKHFNYAVEIFVRPVDLPLISLGRKVRLMFDGFPAIVFSGWPAASYGTFGGVVTAIESNVSVNGKFRILVAEDTSDREWPKELKLGTGANTIALLKDVPIWYELWRNINGFPPDFYVESDKKSNDEKKK